MTETDNLVLEQLRAIRAKQDDHTEWFERIEQRLSVIDHQMAGFADLILRGGVRRGGLRRRIERIEKRLELSDEQQ